MWQGSSGYRSIPTTLNRDMPLKKVRKAMQTKRHPNRNYSQVIWSRILVKRTLNFECKEWQVSEGKFYQFCWNALRNFNRHLGIQSTIEPHRVRMLSAGVIRTLDSKFINVKESLESIDQACLKEVCIGLSLMKYFSEGLGWRKFPGVKEAYLGL